MKRHYFDYAAATPLDADVLAAMHAVESSLGNPASLHAEGRAVKDQLVLARSQIAKVLAVRPDEIVFTSGATESDNLAIFGSLTAINDPQATVLSLATEHAAVLQPLAAVRHSGQIVQEVRLDASGRVDLAALEKALTDEVSLISMAYATSEVGIIQPIAEIGRLVRATRASRLERGIERPIIFHCDAASVAGLQALQVDRLGVDLMTISAAKVYGPTGVGALYVRTGTPLVPLLIGGGQELSRRSGTESIPLAVGFAAALTKAESLRKSEVNRLKDLRSQLWTGIQKLPGVSLNCSLKGSLVNTLNISVEGRDGEALVLALDARGIAVATGAACAHSHHQPSPVLLGLGLSSDQAQSSLRISLGRLTQASDIEALITAFTQILAV